MRDFASLKLLDRQKRITNWLIQVLVLLPIGYFFISCFVFPRHSKLEYTVAENIFGVDQYWRILGPIGCIITVAISVFLERLIPFKTGMLQVNKELLKLTKHHITNTFQINQLSQFELIVDIPFEGDERHNFQKASILKFESRGKKFNFEVSTETQEDLIALRPIVKYWRDAHPNFKYSYKQSNPIVQFLQNLKP